MSSVRKSGSIMSVLVLQKHLRVVGIAQTAVRKTKNEKTNIICRKKYEDIIKLINKLLEGNQEEL